MRRYVLYSFLAVVLAAAGYGVWVWARIAREFDDRGWRLPAQVFAAPLDIYAGRGLSAEDLVAELRRLGYGPVSGAVGPGLYRSNRNRVDVGRRAFTYEGENVPEQTLRIQFAGERIASVADGEGRSVSITQLEPLLIGNIFAAHGEDRIIVTPNEVPPLLPEALKAVEDRRFDTHLGIDARAMVRALLANARAGEISQGGSTLTMQLVRSYFLSNRQTYTRKIREALMSLVLELRHSKDEIMLAYINEIYLGQDGARAIHGFGLASRFYFGKSLSELDVHEIALLVTIVRGPSFYDPRRNPERALARRTLVLGAMRDAGLIDDATFESSKARELGVVTTKGRSNTYYAGFMELVQRQLRSEYDEKELTERGLKIYTTLDPAVQAAAEEALVAETARLQRGRPELEGAVVVTSPSSAEVRALVGSARIGPVGFNRALDARRQIGSLIKPVVYLAALEEGRHSLATQIVDERITIELANREPWTPNNIDGEEHGEVTVVRALAESMNLATVRLGLDVGLGRVADTFEELGGERPREVYPSLLLGAVELTPIRVAELYNTIANGGFRSPLRAVHSIVDGEGRSLQRYSLAIDQVAEPVSVYALNQALVQVMERGTGRAARRALPDRLRVAGKTGTTDDLRDSWFAGFSNDYLAVAWIGNDRNGPIGLTGGAGAAQVWARVMARVASAPYDTPPPEGARSVWIDYDTGLSTDAGCPSAVNVAIPERQVPPKAVDCGSTRTRVGGRLRQWIRNRFGD